MLTQDKKDRLDKMVTQKHLENKQAIAQGKKPPHPTIHDLSKIKNLDGLCKMVEDKKAKQRKEMTDRLVCKSLDKVLKFEADRLDKEGVENAILKFKKAFHIVEWQDGELTSYEHLSEVVSKGSKPWLKKNTLILVECTLRLPKFKNQTEIDVQEFIDHIFNPVIGILKAKPLYTVVHRPNKNKKPDNLWDAPLEGKSRLCKTPKEDWICVKSGSSDFKNYPLEDKKEQKKPKGWLSSLFDL